MATAKRKLWMQNYKIKKQSLKETTTWFCVIQFGPALGTEAESKERAGCRRSGCCSEPHKRMRHVLHIVSYLIQLSESEGASQKSSKSFSRSAWRKSLRKNHEKTLNNSEYLRHALAAHFLQKLLEVTRLQRNIIGEAGCLKCIVACL